MTLFSHNTMTYRMPKQWYFKPLFWVCRCQGKTYIEQYHAGARCFDLRIRFDNGSLEFSHGKMRYDGDDFYSICLFAIQWGLSLRMTLEGEASEVNISKFRTTCKELEGLGAKVWGCYAREADWRVIYDSKTPVPEMIEAYSSKAECKLWQVWPWLYAKLHNKKTLEEYGNTDKTVMMDFI